jgi:hypothetical protein
MFLKLLSFYVLTACLGLALALTLPFTESYWALVAALAGLYLAKAEYLSRPYPGFICLGLLCALFATLSGFLTNTYYLQASFLVLTIIVTAAIGVWRQRYWPMAFVANYLLILGAAFGTDGNEAMQRYLCVVLGFLLVAALRWLFFRKISVYQLQGLFAESLQAASSLSESIFTLYLVRDYQLNIFEYEKQLHSERNTFLQSMSTLRNALLLVSAPHQAAFTKLLQQLDQLYEVLMSIALLLYRVSDHSTFEVANKEFADLSEGIKAQLQFLVASLQQQTQTPPLGFADNLQELQDINHDALQVVAPDPMVFILFIQDCCALKELFLQMTSLIDEVQAT